jgi:bifunctional enzyme CysN/CysC
VILVVNKMDLVEFSEAKFTDIQSSFERFAKGVGPIDVEAVPVSARYGNNVAGQANEWPGMKGLLCWVARSSRGTDAGT